MGPIVLASQVHYYGTAAEIQALSANKGDVGHTTDTGVEYTNTDGATTWSLTRASTGGAMNVTLVDPSDVTRVGEFDNLFKAPLVIDIAHHEIHEGDTYSATITDVAAASGAYVQGYILTSAVTSPQKRMHMVLSQCRGQHRRVYRYRRRGMSMAIHFEKPNGGIDNATLYR